MFIRILNDDYEEVERIQINQTGKEDLLVNLSDMESGVREDLSEYEELLNDIDKQAKELLDDI